MYLGDDFATEIQIYSRCLIFLFIILSFFKKKTTRINLNINLKIPFILLILSLLSIIFGFVVVSESSFKPLVFTIIFIVSLLIPIDKNFANFLFKVVTSIFIIEIIALLITGWQYGPLGYFYLWRTIPVLSIPVPRLYGLLIDSHSSWTLLSYLFLLKIIFSDKSKILVTLISSFLSSNYQILFQNIIVIFFGLPNKNSYFLRAIKRIFKSKINYSLILFGLFFVLLGISLERLDYFDPQQQNTITYAIKQIFDYENFIGIIISQKFFICLFTGCSLKNANYSMLWDVGIFSYVTTIGLIRLIFEFGIFYLTIFFLYTYKLFGFTIFLFYIAGLIHYPVVTGIPFAFYIPYLFRCEKLLYYSNQKNLN